MLQERADRTAASRCTNAAVSMLGGAHELELLRPWLMTQASANIYTFKPGRWQKTSAPFMLTFLINANITQLARL